MVFYVKPNNNCEGLELTSLEELLGGEWTPEPIWSGRPLVRTGSDLVPRQIVGWSSLFGGSAVDVRVYARTDGVFQLAFVGGDWGVRILATRREAQRVQRETEKYAPWAAHLPPGWGRPLMTVEDPEDIAEPSLRKAIQEWK